MFELLTYLLLEACICVLFALFVLNRKNLDWERITLVALGLCLTAALGLSWFLLYPGSKDHFKWFFEGLATVFSVFECDSAEFRRYAAAHSRGALLTAELLSCAIPALTVFTAARLLWNYLPHHVPVGCKVWHIFSEADANSIRMAKDLSRDDQLCIFLRSRRNKLDEDVLTELQGVNYFLYPRDEVRFLRWRPRRRRTLRFYFLSENTDENFERMRDFLKAADEKHLFVPAKEADSESFRQELYLLSETESAPMLIGHLRAMLTNEAVFRSTELRLLDRFRATSYDLLRTKPLYGCIDKDAPEKQLHVLVLGFGKIGREFFRAACSLGILHGCETEFTLCDLDIRDKLSRFLSQCPELDRSVSFRSRSLDADSAALEDLISARDYHYILVALGEDERNIRVASQLKRHYRLRHWEQPDGFQPQICVNIEDPIKHDYVKKLWDSSAKWDKPLHVFGGLNQVFTEEVLMPRELWRAAWYIHSKLSPRKHTWNEYERRSSIACAAHASAYLNIPEVNLTKVIEKWDPTDALCSALTDTEHRRWMAYVRSEGLRRVSTDLMKKYHTEKVKGGHVDILGKLTPCLVETKDELNTVWSEMRKIAPRACVGNRPFRMRDEFIVQHTLDITQLAPQKKT